MRWLAAREDDIPAWLLRERATVGQWRSHERLRRLVFRWRDARFQGDQTIFGALERWLHRSRHLTQYHDGARRGALQHRRELYRITAAKLTREYGTVVIEQFNLANAKRLQLPEAGEDAPRAQRAQLHASAPGELRQAITQAVRRDGGIVASISAIGTTSHCHACGCECTWDKGEELWHRCEHCDELWDQDYNAALNMLRVWIRERAGGEKTLRAAHKP